VVVGDHHFVLVVLLSFFCLDARVCSPVVLMFIERPQPVLPGARPSATDPSEH
jgi:hypothetical protein